MVSETVSWIELLWTAVALIGVGASSLVYVDAARDHKDVKIAGLTGAALITSRMTIRNERLRLGLLLLFALVGVVAMFIPNPPGSFDPPRLLVALMLMAGSCLVVYGSFADRRDRRLILEEL